jgi:ligand-binding sensor domain-containing protein/AraC-like DNA-binding protein
MNQKLVFFLASFLLMPILLCAAIPDMKFRRLDVRDGLSSPQVSCVFRDSRGQVWIGSTYGLNRYDGYRIKTFFSHANDTTSMPLNYVTEVMEAGDGRLWVRHGVVYSIYDPQTERFDRHPEKWLHLMGIKGAIERVYIDKNKNFWVKTYDEGFWFLNAQTQQVRQFAYGDAPQQYNAGIGVSSMTEYGNSLIVVSNYGDMTCFNTQTVWISWKSHTLRRMGAERNVGYTLTVDAQQNLWVLVEGRGYVYLRQAGRWIHSIAETLQYLGIMGLPNDTKIWDVTFDKHQQMWLATDHQGVYVVNLQEKQMRQYVNVKSDETSISDNTLRKIYRDQLDRMWIATYMSGVNYYAENPSHFKHVTVGNINTVSVDREGVYWLGSNERGIIRYQSKTGEQTVFDKHNSGLGSDVIVSSLVATDDVLWFGTYEGGLIQYKNGKFLTIKATDKVGGLANNSVWALSEDPWGHIWVGTLGSGLQRIDRKTGVFTTLNTKTGLASDYISSIQLTRDGWLLVGHTEFYSLVNPRTMEIKNCRIEAPHNDIPLLPSSNQVMEDSRGLIWQCTASGVTIVDVKKGKTYHMDTDDGLFGTANGIVEDRHNTIWVVMHNGLSAIIPQQQKNGMWSFVVHSFNSRDGLQDAPFNQRSAILTPDGELLVGGYEGLDMINTNDWGHRHNEEMPIVSGVKVLDRAGQPVADRLDLDYEENHFTIQLASNNGEVHNRSRFAYRLMGLNDQWVYTEETNPNAIYTGLSSGSYTFCVRMLNDDGTLGEKECRLKIHIAAPWYRSWWMMLVYLMAIIAALYYRKRIYKLVKDLQELSHKVMEHSKRDKLQPQIKEVEITDMDEKLVRDATDYVEANLGNSDLSVETMAEALAMSRVHLYKKLTAITDLTPSEFIRQIRLRHAEQLLRKSQMTVAEVAYKVGFNNPRYFSKYFKEMYGKMPSEYKNSLG